MYIAVTLKTTARTCAPAAWPLATTGRAAPSCAINSHLNVRHVLDERGLHVVVARACACEKEKTRAGDDGLGLAAREAK